MKQPYVSTLIEQDFTSAEKALGRHNIDAISSADLEGYATQEWVQDQNYITSADLPDVSDMATKTWTSEKFYPDTNPSGFITSSDVPRYREGEYISIDPISLAISVTGINPDAYLTSADMSQYATHEEVESATSGKMDSSEASAFYPRYENPEGYLTSGDLPDFHVYSAGQYVNIEGDTINVTGVYPDTNPSGFATSSWVVEQNYITSADVPVAQEYSAGPYVSIVDHVVSVTGLQPEGDYLTRDEASAFLTSADLPDLTDYVTSADVSGFVDVNYVENNFYSASNPSGFLTSADIPHIEQVQSDWSEDDDTDPSYIQNKPDPVGLEALSPLYIIDETSASKIGIYTSAIPELSGYVTKSYVDENFYSASNPSGFITSADLPDLSDYATKDYVDSETSGKQDTLTFGYTDNKISSINSSAIYYKGGSGSEVYRTPYGGSETFVSALKIDSDDPDGYAYVTADDVGQGYLVSGPYKKLLDAGVNGVGDSATPIYIDNNGTFKPVSATFTQEQSDWTEANTASASYIKHKPTPVGLKAGAGITLTDQTSSVLISSNVPYPTVECQAISVNYSGYVKVVYPQSSACCELHVTTPYRYDAVAEYSAKIDDDMTWAIPSGCWYDFIKQDFGGTTEWCFKDSGHYYG